MTDILINTLKDAQKKHGYLSEDVLKNIAKEKKLPYSKVYGTASFYMMLKTKEQGRNIIEMCNCPSCILNGAQEIFDYVEKKLEINFGETTSDNLISLYKTSCIGCCDESPAMLLNEEPITLLSIEKMNEIIEEIRMED